ncbi:thioesterase family protein [Micromonospora sp. FIMYZ51]|uniref:thioesterase family protein n=1 Tax=Micromonospora sp. FIMYZ51 TaxID=3051832 RepID=UPI00311EB764
MTTTMPERTSLSMRPGYEGANIRTWIGFKHFMYLAEAAVLQWFRDRDLGPHRLLHEHGLGWEVIDSSVQLPAVLEVDDEVRAEVTRIGGRRFSVVLTTERDGGTVTVLRGKLTVALIPEAIGVATAPVPEAYRELRVASFAEAVTPAPQPEPGDFRWSWRVPYFYCHFTDRLQHSGYVRALEEVVDRFLADRGISVGRLLAERSWIPVVSRARVRQLAPVHMEETLHTTLTVGDVLRDTMFEARMDCHVLRDGQPVHTATATILHGYAISAGPQAGSLANLGEIADVLTGRSGS